MLLSWVLVWLLRKVGSVTARLMHTDSHVTPARTDTSGCRKRITLVVKVRHPLQLLIHKWPTQCLHPFMVRNGFTMNDVGGWKAPSAFPSVIACVLKMASAPFHRLPVWRRRSYWHGMRWDVGPVSVSEEYIWTSMHWVRYDCLSSLNGLHYRCDTYSCS